MSISSLWSKNKQIIVVTASIFIISLATILFFTPGTVSDDLKTNILGHNPAHEEDKGGGHKYEEILENAENPYFVLNKDAKVAEFSESFSKMFNDKAENIEGMFLFDFVVKEDQEKLFKNFRDVSDKKEPRYKAGPYRISHNENEHIVFLSFYALETGENVLVEINDVTDDLNKLRNKIRENTDQIEDNSRIVVEKMHYYAKL